MNELDFKPLILGLLATLFCVVMMNHAYASFPSSKLEHEIQQSFPHYNMHDINYNHDSVVITAHQQQPLFFKEAG